MSGLNTPLSKSRDIEEDMASSKPAAVDKAAAKPPAATIAIIQLGRLAISGLARTIISLSTLTISLSLAPVYWIKPSPFLSSNLSNPVFSQF